MVVDQRTPAVLGPRPRAVDAYRDVIERYDVNGLNPPQRLPERGRVIEGLVEELKPLLDAMVEADAAASEVRHLEQTLDVHDGTLVGTVARSRLIRARARRDLAFGRVRELVREERTVLRYVLLRHLVRSRSAIGT
jgi:hypothetical protein